MHNLHVVAHTLRGAIVGRASVLAPGPGHPDRLLSRKQLKRLIAVSTMTLWRCELDGRLPKHLKIGRKAFWRLGEIRALIESAR
jgi:predicted DNA-binding transcriptional regulator AlpA